MVEESTVLVLEAVLEVVSVEDAAEFAEQTQRVLNVGWVHEVGIDVGGQLGLDTGHVHVEFDEITIKGVVLVVEERVSDLCTERAHVDIEGINDGLDVFKVVLLEGLELADSAEKVDKLANTAAEEIELAENLGLVEIELAGLGHALEALLSELVLLDVRVLQLLAALQDHDELIVGVLGLVPQATVFEG